MLTLPTRRSPREGLHGKGGGILDIEHVEPAVSAEIVTTAPPERVWAAFAEPDILCGWFTDRAKGRARVGATVTWCFDRFRMELPYEVLVADPGEHLVLKGSPVGRPPYLFEVRLDPDGAGTRVRLVNSGFGVGSRLDEQREGVESGWRVALAILKLYLESHFGLPRATFFAMQPAEFDYPEVRELFLREDRLARWLTSRGNVGAPGDRCALVLRGGAPLTGCVLEVTSREAVVSWEEISGVLELKSFLLGPRIRAVALRGCGWGLDEDRAAGIEKEMARAIDRLVEELSGPG